MKLSQLYASNSFKNIVFNDGLNLILAKVTKPKDYNVDSHNLGKTTLIAVIDFLLLKKIDRNHFFLSNKAQFAKIVLFLEVKLNSGEFLTIRRSIESQTKASIKFHSFSENFLQLEDWDYKDVSIANAKSILNDKLYFDVIPQWDYRKSLTYFLRSQNDYRDVFQLAKFSQGKDVNWKPFLFDLLGFKGELLTKKYDLDTSKVRQKALIQEFEERLSIDTTEVDKIKGAIELKKEEQKEFQQLIDSFNFYEKERSLSKELIEDIENKISELNSQEYSLEYEIERIQNSFKSSFSFDINQIVELFKETEVFFPNNLVNGYKELEEFNRKITEERNKYLNEQLNKARKTLEDVRSELNFYDAKRSGLLNTLQEKDSFKKFKSYQIDLAKIESDIIRLEEKLRSINMIDHINELIKGIDSDLNQVSDEINKQIISTDNAIYSEVRKNFRNIMKFLLNVPAIIYLRHNSQGNIDFEAEIQNDNEIDMTSKGKGHSYKKLLCIAFDLSILMVYSKKSFFKFVYHDGAIEGLDNRKKINFINYARKICKEHNLQYIFTSIEHDIPKEILNTVGKKEICLTLDDSGDKGKLFEFSF